MKPLREQSPDSRLEAVSFSIPPLPGPPALHLVVDDRAKMNVNLLYGIFGYILPYGDERGELAGDL